MDHAVCLCWKLRDEAEFEVISRPSYDLIGAAYKIGFNRCRLSTSHGSRFSGLFTCVENFDTTFAHSFWKWRRNWASSNIV